MSISLSPTETTKDDRKIIVIATPLSRRRMMTTTAASYAVRETGWVSYALEASWSIAKRTKQLRFRCPEHGLRAGVLGGVKVRAEIGGYHLEKSYSPTSHPERRGYFDLVVKAYPPRPGGGLGAMLCDLVVGQDVEMKVKPPKLIHGLPLARNRWKAIGMLVAGTGVAPAASLIETLVNDPEDTTRLSLLASHRHLDDVILHEYLSSQLGNSSHTTLTGGGETLSSGFSVGRVDHHKVTQFLPRPHDDDVLILVCGTDAFVDSMAGPITRVKDPITGVKHKVQGPTLGILGDHGFLPHQVFKL